MRHKIKQITQFFENAYYPIYWLDRDARIVYANKSACKELGYSSDEMMRMSLYEIDPEADKPKWEQSLGDIISGKLTYIETVQRRKDGSEFPVRVSLSSAGTGKDIHICAILRNVTKERQAQQQQEHLEFAVENAVDGFFLTKAHGEIVYVNKSACETLGYSFEELTSMNASDIDPETVDVEVGRIELKNQIISGDHGMFETRHRRKDGTIIPVEVTFKNISYGGEQYSFAFVHDITERKKSNRMLEILRFTIDNAVDSIYMTDKDARIFYANKRACKSLGYSKEELLNRTVYDIDPECTPEVYNAVWDGAHSGELESIERIHRKKDGTFYPVDISVNNSVYDGFAYSCTFSRDVTERKAAERQLLFNQFAIDSAGDAVFITNSKGEVIYANQTACRSLGYTREELTSLDVKDIVPSMADGSRNYKESWDLLIKNGKFTTVSQHRRKDGSVYPVEVNTTILEFEGEQYSCGLVRDITERLEAEKALRDSEEKFRLISDTSPVALIIHRMADGRILYINSMAEALFGVDLNNAENYSFSSLFNQSDSGLKFLEKLATGKQIYGDELMLKTRNSEPVWISINAKTIILQGEQVVCCAFQDISEAHELSTQLTYQATFDSLTGLVNRREFEIRLQRVIKTAEQQLDENAMCFMDLDQFKIINDTCGHVAGDELLRQVAQVLKNDIRKRDTLARLGGDEFAVLLENCSLEQAMRVADSIRESIRNYRFIWENNSFNIGVSIGLVPINNENEDITEVLKRADAACYEAKEKGRNRVHVYHPGDEEISHRHGEMQWVTRITSALEENRLQLWAQKIIPIRETRRGEHFELLVRLIERDGQIILPSAFLPAAERYNLIPRLDRWVVATSLRWFKMHPDMFNKLWMCSINLSGQSLGDEEFIKDITEYFEDLGVAANRFCFEVTETATIANLNHATRFIKLMAKRGCRFALDDFGSGLSSYAYLKNLPVDYIKIDGMFVEDLLVNPMHTALVKSINEVGHVMGKKTIAEYVENDAILQELEDIGVDYAQGYGIEKPVLLIDGSTMEIEHFVN